MEKNREVAVERRKSMVNEEATQRVVWWMKVEAVEGVEAVGGCDVAWKSERRREEKSGEKGDMI